MLDTVVLTIPKELFSILNHNKFSPSTEYFFKSPYYHLGSRSNFSCYQNPTKVGKGKLEYTTNGKQKYIGNGKQKYTIKGKQKYIGKGKQKSH